MAADGAAAAAAPGAGAAAAAVVAPIAAAPPDARAAALALLGGVGDESAERVAALTEQRNQIDQDRKRVAMGIKQEAKKHQRLMTKAQGLSDGDLMTIISNRAVAKAKAEAKAKAKAKAKS